MNGTTVLHLRNPTGWYGVEEIIATLAEGLKPKGCRTLIVSLENTHHSESLFLQTLEKRGIPATRLPGRGMVLLFRLMGYVRKQQVEILHTHTYKSDLWGWLVAKATGRKVMTTVHGWTDSNRKLRLMGKGNRLLLKHFDKVVFTSNHLASELKHLDPSQIEIIPNGIDLKKRFSRESEGSTTAIPFAVSTPGERLAVIGRLGPEKGHSFLFEAMAGLTKQNPELKLWVVGEGPLQGSLVKLAETLRIADRILFSGYQKEIGKVLSLVDLVVSPSLQEGCPLALIEAMAYGKPIVASDVPGIRETLGGYPKAHLFPPKDARAMASAIRLGLSAQREQQGREPSCPISLPERFSSERMVEEYARVYRELRMGRTEGRKGCG
jgi:glycosyltransferase involved in cell wall biosynthesis